MKTHVVISMMISLMVLSCGSRISKVDRSSVRFAQGYYNSGYYEESIKHASRVNPESKFYHSALRWINASKQALKKQDENERILSSDLRPQNWQLKVNGHDRRK